MLWVPLRLVRLPRGVPRMLGLFVRLVWLLVRLVRMLGLPQLWRLLVWLRRRDDQRLLRLRLRELRSGWGHSRAS